MSTVCVVGSGGREHALAWKLAQSPQVDKIILAPGGDGMVASEDFDRIKIETVPFFVKEKKQGFEKLAQTLREKNVDLAVIGPDNPLADGISDVLRSYSIPTFGPSEKAAQIEASKTFCKQVLISSKVKTAQYFVAHSLSKAKEFLSEAPWGVDENGKLHGWVVKADGLALGKGVEVCSNLEQALKACKRLIQVSNILVIEEQLFGKELSWMAFADGKTCRLLQPARDYKPLLDGQKGPNTGGMGAYSPVAEVLNDKFEARVLEQVFEPVLNELEKRDCRFQGLLYAGLMWNEKTDELWVLEFNARFGDPETQVVIPRMQDDLFEWCMAVAEGKLAQMPDKIAFSKQPVVCVVGASPGYPQSAKKGLPIQLNGNHGLTNSEIDYFVAGMKKNTTGDFETSGGRVFCSVGMADDLSLAKDQAYQKISKVEFSGMQFRKDIALEEKLNAKGS